MAGNNRIIIGMYTRLLGIALSNNGVFHSSCFKIFIFDLNCGQHELVLVVTLHLESSVLVLVNLSSFADGSVVLILFQKFGGRVRIVVQGVFCSCAN